MGGKKKGNKNKGSKKGNSKHSNNSKKKNKRKMTEEGNSHRTGFDGTIDWFYSLILGYNTYNFDN